MRFPFSLELLLRLPAHPDWKYELITGEARLSPRPRPLGFLRRTGTPVPTGPAYAAEVRPIQPATDLAAVAALLTEVWAEQDPYRSLAPSARDNELRGEVERSTAPPTTVEGAIAIDRRGACACALLTRSSAAPRLTWLSVRRDARGRGLATALLGVIVEMLAARGEPDLASNASAANLPSLRWHLARDFALTPDPIYALQRPDASGGRMQRAHGTPE